MNIPSYLWDLEIKIKTCFPKLEKQKHVFLKISFPKLKKEVIN